jgi:hypothetical protein
LLLQGIAPVPLPAVVWDVTRPTKLFGHGTISAG